MGTILRGTVGGFGLKFAPPRPYIYGFATNWPGVGVSTLVGPEWRITLDASFGFAYKRMVFRDYFFNWHKRRVYFEDMFEDFYVVIPPNAPQAAEGFSLHYKTHPVTEHLYLAMDVGFWTDWFYVSLPPSPTDYWLKQAP